MLLFKVAVGKQCWHVAADQSPVYQMVAKLVVALSGHCRELSACAVCLVLRQNCPVNLPKAFLCPEWQPCCPGVVVLGWLSESQLDSEALSDET